MLTALVRAEEELRELPVEPIWIGAGALVALVGVLVGVLMFGKGRPHS